MGLTVVLEDERGEAIEEVGDPQNLLHEVLPATDDERSRCLRFIDWFADTTFNSLQMEEFLKELAAVRSSASSEEAAELLDRIGKLARRVEKEVHLYLKFYGD